MVPFLREWDHFIFQWQYCLIYCSLPLPTLNLAAWIFPSHGSQLLPWVNACIVLSCHTFQSESILYSCLNVKELVARRRREIWSLSDCGSGLWVRVQLQSLNRPMILNICVCLQEDCHQIPSYILVYSTLALTKVK